jgi:hypothetical protein
LQARMFQDDRGRKDRLIPLISSLSRMIEYKSMIFVVNFYACH